MARVHMRGGPWSNAEDQILTSALGQYGMRDWERVASMLPQKTAAQCRERFENYLDPRLSLHEAWGPEEEERLAELQGLFPNQWRLISGELARSTPSHFIRPPWLCEQHYLEMRDAHEYERQKQAQEQRQQQQQQRSGDGEDGDDTTTATADVPPTLEEWMRERRQRRVAYQAHEEKAARGDTIGGDRLHEEMLTMAVSRLANQDQKKGLRKERERRLEEASFLAKLESNREAIESGTLSARQEKRMRRALETDRSGRKAARREGEKEDEDGIVGGEESGDEEELFQPMDVAEDQQRAGIQRKARTLLVDLGAQQMKVAESRAGGSSAAAGVNLSLLDQVAAPVAAPAIEARPRVHGIAGKSVGGSSGSDGTTWAALAAPASGVAVDPDSLFASLPSIVDRRRASTTALPQSSSSTEFSSAPTRQLDTVRSALSSVAAAAQGADDARDFSVPPALSAIPQRRCEAAAGTSSSSGRSAMASPSLTESSSSAKRSVAVSQDAWAAVPPASSAAMDHAAVLVAVEAERALAAERRRRDRAERAAVAKTVSFPANDVDAKDHRGDDEEDSEADDDDEETGTAAVTPSEVAAVQARLRALTSCSGPGEKDAVPPAELVAAVAEAQRAAAEDRTLLGGDSHCIVPLRALEASVHNAVARVNARLATMEGRVRTVAAACFDVGEPTRAGDVATATGTAAQASVGLPRLQQRWAARLATATQQATFLEALREKEGHAMANRLHGVRAMLAALQARESQLQDLYRQRRTQR